jgi:O-antigen ligase
MVQVYALIIEGGLLSLVIGAPLAFGAVYPWGTAGIELVALLMALAWALQQLQTRRLQWVRTPLNLPMLLFVGLVGLQLLPLPPALLHIVSPHTYAMYQRTLMGWPERDPLPLTPPTLDAAEAPSDISHPMPSAAGPPALSPWRPLSLYSHATLKTLGEALTSAVVYLLVVNTITTRTQLVRLLTALLATGTVIAVLGLIQQASGVTKIYGWWQPEFGGAPFGPYVNRNHGAGYLAMLLPVGLGWLWGQLGPRRHGIVRGAWPDSLKTLLSGRDGLRLLLVFAVVNMAAALLVSASRGGILSATVAVGFLTVMRYLPRRQERRVGLVIPVALTVAVAYAGWLGLDRTLARVSQPEAGRPLIWSGTLNLIGDYPWLGTGLGTYVSSFRRHKPTLNASLVEHAHYDYLELWAEMGAAGVLIVVGGLGWFGYRTLRRWSARHDPEVRGIALGGLAGVLAIGVHSLVDFNLHIPANALTFAVILGLIAVAVHLRGPHNQAVMVFRVRRLRLPRLVSLALSPVLVLAALVLGIPVLQHLAADRQAQLAEQLERADRATAAPDLALEPWARAVALDPGQADYWYHLGQARAREMQAQWTRDPFSAFRAGVRAMMAYRAAIVRNPTSPFPYLAWSWALEDVNRLAPWLAGPHLRPATASSDAVSDDGLPALRRQLAQHPDAAAHWSAWLLQTATHLAPTTAFAHYSAGLHRLQRWDRLSTEEQRQVVQELRSALQLEPRYASAILPRLWDVTHDRDLALALARGTPEERRWRADAGTIRLNR